MLEQSADSVNDVSDGEALRLIFPENYDKIIGLAPDVMPEKSLVAAIYRYWIRLIAYR